MGIRKSIGMLAVAALAAMSAQQTTQAPLSGADQQTASEQGTKGSKPTQQQPAQKEQKNRITRKITIRSGGMGDVAARVGLPPKQWGQFLQSKGRQKWDKKRRA